MINSVLVRIRFKITKGFGISIDGIQAYRVPLFTGAGSIRRSGFLFLGCILAIQLSAAELIVADFSRSGLEIFNERRFVGQTDYKLVTVDGEKVLRAESRNNASALYRQLDIDLQQTPYLNWRWRVDNIHQISNQQAKVGDDYPARVYVVVKEGFFPWQTIALNYIWSNNIEKHAYWFNPFTEKAIMIPVRSGTEGLGQWHQQRVNVREDFYRIFGRRIERAHGVAIMSDGDNSGSSAVAYYGGIFFSD